jgi:hypothetical protein
MAKRARMPTTGDRVELAVNLPDYNLAKGEIGTILVAYSSYDKNTRMNDFEVFFEKINISVIVLESEFKLVE